MACSSAFCELVSPQGVTTEHTDGKEKEDSSPILPSTSHSVRKKPVRRRTAGQTATGRSVHHHNIHIRLQFALTMSVLFTKMQTVRSGLCASGMLLM